MTPVGLVVAEAVVVGVLGGGGVAFAERLARRREGATFAGQAGPRAAQVAAAVLAGLAVWAATSWPAAGAWAALGGWAVPSLLRRDRARAAEAVRLDAWATWVGLIAGQLASQASLAEALLAACRRAPAVLGADLAPLRSNLGRLPLDEALTAWSATSAASAELDQVGLVLSLAAAGAGGHVAQVLSQLGTELRARASSARRIERERRRTRLAGRAAAGVAGAWMLAGARFDRSLFSVYAHPAGQLLLAGVIGILAAGLWGLARLDRGIA
jgi:hypothetical protein